MFGHFTVTGVTRTHCNWMINAQFVYCKLYWKKTVLKRNDRCVLFIQVLYRSVMFTKVLVSPCHGLQMIDPLVSMARRVRRHRFILIGADLSKRFPVWHPWVGPRAAKIIVEGRICVALVIMIRVSGNNYPSGGLDDRNPWCVDDMCLTRWLQNRCSVHWPP